METINDLIPASVEQFGGLIALMEPSSDASITMLSFHELQQRVRSFAGYLQVNAFQKGERILIWSESRIDWMVAYFSVLLIGGVVVPLDIHSREEFICHIAQSTEANT